MLKFFFKKITGLSKYKRKDFIDWGFTDYQCDKSFTQKQLKGESEIEILRLKDISILIEKTKIPLKDLIEVRQLKISKRDNFYYYFESLNKTYHSYLEILNELLIRYEQVKIIKKLGKESEFAIPEEFYEYEKDKYNYKRSLRSALEMKIKEVTIYEDAVQDILEYQLKPYLEKNLNIEDIRFNKRDVTRDRSYFDQVNSPGQIHLPESFELPMIKYEPKCLGIYADNTRNKKAFIIKDADFNYLNEYQIFFNSLRGNISYYYNSSHRNGYYYNRSIAPYDKSFNSNLTYFTCGFGAASDEADYFMKNKKEILSRLQPLAEEDFYKNLKVGVTRRLFTFKNKKRTEYIIENEFSYTDFVKEENTVRDELIENIRNDQDHKWAGFKWSDNIVISFCYDLDFNKVIQEKSNANILKQFEYMTQKFYDLLWIINYVETEEILKD